MRIGQENVVPFAFDMSMLVERSVASLYSNLVTRPTGRALRLGIESQIGELGSCCLSVLDFTQVVVLDYSCADEAVAKLIQRYVRTDRPADVYFVARGLAEQHRDPIDVVLLRHRLALTAEVIGNGFQLLGDADPLQHLAWECLRRHGTTDHRQVAIRLGSAEGDVRDALDGLAERRVVLRSKDRPFTYTCLTGLLAHA